MLWLLLAGWALIKAGFGLYEILVKVGVTYRDPWFWVILTAWMGVCRSTLAILRQREA